MFQHDWTRVQNNRSGDIQLLDTSVTSGYSSPGPQPIQYAPHAAERRIFDHPVCIMNSASVMYPILFQPAGGVVWYGCLQNKDPRPIKPRPPTTKPRLTKPRPPTTTPRSTKPRPHTTKPRPYNKTKTPYYNTKTHDIVPTFMFSDFSLHSGLISFVLHLLIWPGKI
jgi:hypothetical protein